MFQDALVESNGRLQTRKPSLSFLAFTINATVLVAMVLWPLLHPLALPRQALAMLIVAPAPPASPAPVAAAPAQRLQPRAMTIDQLAAPSVIPRTISTVSESAPVSSEGLFTNAGSLSGTPGSPIGDVFNGLGRAQTPAVVAAVPRKVAVSSGVMAGAKIAGVDPIYPAIARTADIQGTIVIQATLSKTGTIENLRVLGGPAMLRTAAIDAVSTWRYRPYLLNGQPVEVETTINVVFSLGR